MFDVNFICKSSELYLYAHIMEFVDLWQKKKRIFLVLIVETTCSRSRH